MFQLEASNRQGEGEQGLEHVWLVLCHCVGTFGQAQVDQRSAQQVYACSGALTMGHDYAFIEQRARITYLLHASSILAASIVHACVTALALA